MSEHSRLEVLERLVRHLSADVAALRDEVRAQRAAGSDTLPDASARPADRSVPHLFAGIDEDAGTGAPELPPLSPLSPLPPLPPLPRPPRPRPERPASAAPREAPLDVEGLIGRYGTVALGAITIIMGVGAFLRWAVDHVQLGPGPRVGLGVLVAGGLAGFGWRLRARGARQFGDTLVGLGLAVLHVVAWGAGPYLHLVPDAVSLGIAALASVLLAVLAWREGEQPLFVVGTGGALLAPFVTTSGGGRAPVLLTYGLVLIVTGTAALRPRHWRVARRVIASGALAYVGAALATTSDVAGWTMRAAPMAFALACTLAALLLGGEWHRRPLAYSHLASALLAHLVLARPLPPMAATVVLGLLGAVLAVVASRGEGAPRAATGEHALGDARGSGGWRLDAASLSPPWVGGAGFPLAFLAATLLAIDPPEGMRGASVALVHAALAGGLALALWGEGAARRGAHLIAGQGALAVAVLLALPEQSVPTIVLLAVLGAIGATLAARTRTPLAIGPALLTLLVATVLAAVGLMERVPWRYVPFLTLPSLAAAATVAAWALATRESRVLVPSPPPGGVAPVLFVLWGREELRHAWSVELATVLVIAWYATTGMVAIALGRRRGEATWRRAGLALAVLAAFKALAEASRISHVGLRVGSFLLVGGFLLGVAWWYRVGGGSGEVPQDVARASA